MLKWIAMMAASMALVAAVACGGGDDEKTIDLGDGNEITVGDDLPDDWPDDFPVYDGADLQGASQGEQDGITGIVATWTTGDSVEDVTSFYNDEFENGEWSVTLTGNAAGSTYWAVENSDGSQAGYVAVTGNGGDDTLITATVGDNPDGSSSGDNDGDSSGDDGSSVDGSSDDGSSDDGSSDDGSSDDGSSDSGSGDVELPDAVDLPDDYPADLIALPDGARIINVQSYSANGQTTYIVSFVSEDDVETIGDAIDGSLTSEGYKQGLKTSDGTGFYATYTENEDGSGGIVAVSVNESSSYDGYQEGVIQVTTGV